MSILSVFPVWITIFEVRDKKILNNRDFEEWSTGVVAERFLQRILSLWCFFDLANEKKFFHPNFSLFLGGLEYLAIDCRVYNKYTGQKQDSFVDTLSVFECFIACKNSQSKEQIAKWEFFSVDFQKENFSVHFIKNRRLTKNLRKWLEKRFYVEQGVAPKDARIYLGRNTKRITAWNIDFSMFLIACFVTFLHFFASESMFTYTCLSFVSVWNSFSSFFSH